MVGESLGFSPHNPKVVSSNPAPATKTAGCPPTLSAGFFVAVSVAGAGFS
jgi:hypothetical protein